MVTIQSYAWQECKCIASLLFVFNPKTLSLNWLPPTPGDRLGSGFIFFVCVRARARQPPLFLCFVLFCLYSYY